MTRTLPALLVVTLVLATLATPVAAGSVDPRFEGLVADPSLEPGQEATITVQLLNDAADADDVAETAENVEVTLTAGDSPLTVNSGTTYVGDIADGDPQELSFRVAVPPDAAPGEYDLRLVVRYEFEDEAERSTVSVPVTIDPVARFGDASTESDVQIGDTGPLALTLENVGDAVAHDATVVLETGSAELSFPAGAARTEVFVGRWSPGDAKTVRTELTVADTARLREYPLKATVRYEDDGGRQRVKPVAATITPAPRQSFEVVDVASTAPIGGTGVLNLSVRNVGPATAYASTVTVASADADLTFAGGAPQAESFTGDWAPGEVRHLTYRLRVNDGAIVRDYPVRATVEYEDADGIDRRPRTVVAAVRPEPEQTFELTDVRSTLTVGDEGTLEGVITNTGTTTVRNAVVVFDAEIANLVPAETEFAVGDLAPGETATFAFDAEVTSSADAGPRQVSLVVRYRDSDDDVRRSEPLDARVDVGPRSDVFTVEPVTTSFTAGSTGVLELRVTNDGEEAVSDVSAKLFADDPLASGDDEAFIDELGPGESTVIRFGVSTGAGAIERKVYPVSLDFQYEDAEGDTRLSDSYDVPVRVLASQGSEGPSTTVIGGAIVAALAVIGAVVLWRRR
ncbi:MAG: hypothetical protein U5J98_11295 [Halobacteriales archaeon]|nr:hypothetical protein [Halobacteriales archaeon]